MLYRPLGRTGIDISTVSFGAGPVSALMTSPEKRDEQRRVIQRAAELGINWFDTAATYGEGRSEESLGGVLDELQLAGQVHVATKVRIPPERTGDLRGYVLQSFEESLRRLRLPRITLLQIHNSITTNRNDLPTSLAPKDILETGAMLDGLLELKNSGLVEHLGITGLGNAAALLEVLKSGQFATVQAPYNLLNPSAGREMPTEYAETNLGNLFATCQKLNVGVLAIRVYAGGALAGQPPSAHTLTTKFFPLDLYKRDQCRAAGVAPSLPPGMSLPEVALRFAIAHPGVASALIGLGSVEQVEQAVAYAERGPLPAELIESLTASVERAESSL